MTNKQYHNSEKVCLICPECKEEVRGISQAQAEANMKEHKRSTIHKKIKHALHMSGANLIKRGEVSKEK